MGSRRPFNPITFWCKVNKNGPIPEVRPDLGPCWLWTGHQSDNGYGLYTTTYDPADWSIRIPKRPIGAHRFSYKLAYGPIPDDLPHIDHLCFVRLCVNPTHLEAVTQTENNERAGETRRAIETACPSGHMWDESNTYWGSDGSRKCRACAQERDRQRQQTQHRKDYDRIRAQRRNGTPEMKEYQRQRYLRKKAERIR